MRLFQKFLSKNSEIRFFSIFTEPGEINPPYIKSDNKLDFYEEQRSEK